ncbi:hypothetical protein [Rosistilla oblonga]|uniref:hypothetical protein n=1 Tax=Rosistilla oblonga TaxID=2527990 RepID=UPI003A97035D
MSKDNQKMLTVLGNQVLEHESLRARTIGGPCNGSRFLVALTYSVECGIDQYPDTERSTILIDFKLQIGNRLHRQVMTWGDFDDSVTGSRQGLNSHALHGMYDLPAGGVFPGTIYSIVNNSIWIISEARIIITQRVGGYCMDKTLTSGGGDKTFEFDVELRNQ